MKVAIAGCNELGYSYARDFSRMNQIEVVAFYDTDREAAARVAQYYEVPSYLFIDNMMQSSKPDILCIAEPALCHNKVLLTAALHRVHVLSQQPLASKVSDVRNWFEQFREKGLYLHISNAHRFSPQYVHIRDAIAGGQIGKVGVVNAKRFDLSPIGRMDVGNGAGVSDAIMKVMIQDIDLMSWLFGEAKSVFALSQRTEHLEYVTVTLRYRTGAIVNLETCFGYPESIASVEIAGSKGIIRADSRSSQAVRLLPISSDGMADKLTVASTPTVYSPYYKEANYFAECIRNGVTSKVTEEDQCNALGLAYATIDSIVTRRPVKIPGTL